MKTRLGALVASVLATGLLAACSPAESIVGIRPAPSERADVAPLDVEGAKSIAIRLLGQGDEAVTKTGSAGVKARKEVFTGDALAVANAQAAMPSKAPDPDLTEQPDPKVLAQSQGRDWPRAIIVGNLDERVQVQYLHVLVSPSAAEPFKIASTVAMFSGAKLPSLGAAVEGAPKVEADDGKGIVASPSDVAKGYAAALAYPKPKSSKVVASDDPYATALKTAVAAQAKALKGQATVAEVHKPELKGAYSFRLADGGVVTFTMLSRTDTLKASSGTKELVLPSALAKLVGKSKVTKSATIESIEPVAFLIPRSGKASVLGANEYRVGGSGS